MWWGAGDTKEMSILKIAAAVAIGNIAAAVIMALARLFYAELTAFYNRLLFGYQYAAFRERVADIFQLIGYLLLAGMVLTAGYVAYETARPAFARMPVRRRNNLIIAIIHVGAALGLIILDDYIPGAERNSVYTIMPLMISASVFTTWRISDARERTLFWKLAVTTLVNAPVILFLIGVLTVNIHASLFTSLLFWLLSAVLLLILEMIVVFVHGFARHPDAEGASPTVSASDKPDDDDPAGRNDAAMLVEPTSR